MQPPVATILHNTTLATPCPHGFLFAAFCRWGHHSIRRPSPALGPPVGLVQRRRTSPWGCGGAGCARARRRRARGCLGQRQHPQSSSQPLHRLRQCPRLPLPAPATCHHRHPSTLCQRRSAQAAPRPAAAAGGLMTWRTAAALTTQGQAGRRPAPSSSLGRGCSGCRRRSSRGGSSRSVVRLPRQARPPTASGTTAGRRTNRHRSHSASLLPLLAPTLPAVVGCTAGRTAPPALSLAAWGRLAHLQLALQPRLVQRAGVRTAPGPHSSLPPVSARQPARGPPAARRRTGEEQRGRAAPSGAMYLRTPLALTWAEAAPAVNKHR